MTIEDDAKRPWRAGSLLKWAALALACLVLWRALAKADLARSFGYIVAIGPMAGVVLGTFLAAMAIDVIGWRHLYAGLGRHISFLPFLATRLAGEAIILSLPGGQMIAEPMAPYLLRDRCGLPLSEGFAGLGLKKLLFTIAHGALIFGGALVGWSSLVRVSPQLVHGVWLPWAIAAIGLAVMVACAFGLWGLVRGAPARRLIDALSTFPVAVIRHFAEQRRGAFLEADTHLAEAWRTAHRTRAFLCFLGFWAIEALETWWMLRLLGAPLGMREVLSFEAAVSLLRAMAFFVPAGLGVQDAGYMAMFSALGVSDATNVGAAFVILKRAKEVVWIAIGYALLLSMRSLRQPTRS